MVVRLQVRHDTKQSWEYNNPILANGEIGVEIDNELIANRMKVGNGNDKWNDLKFMDENLVHSVPTGAEAENIDGEKVFNNDVTIKSNIHLPSDKTIEGMFSHAESDSEGNVISEFYQRTLSYVDNYVDESTDWNTCVNNGVYEVYASSFNEDLNTPLQYKDNIGTQGFLLVYADKDGNVMQVYKPALISSSTATVIPVYRIKEDATDTWTAWTSFTDSDTNIVHTFNNEEISGVKTFINKVVINNGVLELGNGVGASEIKKKNGETILTEDSNGLTLSTTRNTIRLRPNGSNESNGEVVINNDGVINGKALKDSEGNVITSVYAKKADVIKTAKAHTLAESELLSSNEYPEYYQKVLDKKKKSFDISKFTVVGNPTITDDGIASGFSASNYLKFPVIQLGTYNSWTIISPEFTTGNDITTSQWIMKITYGDYYGGIRIYFDNSKLKIDAGSDTTHDSDIFRFNTLSISANTKYQVKISFTGTEYIVWYKTNDGSWQEYDRVSSTTKLYNSLQNAYIGYSHGNIRTWMLGSIDLTQFSIEVDGEEVFNGHEERLDIIKADNYTVVGSPIISKDGVASGFSTSNYVNIGTFSPNDKPWTIYIKVTTGSNANLNEQILGCTDAIEQGIEFGIRNSKWIWWLGESGYNISHGGSSSYTVLPDTTYWIKISFNGTTYQFNYSLDGKDYLIGMTAISDKKIGGGGKSLGCDAFQKTAPWTGSIDLNSFKIYVDGNLVHQPCLKIPYTYSKDGTKVVDIGYIDRVEDCYNQFGTGNYFILDEYNNMFQMPLDTVDGYTRTLYNYRKGKTSYNYNTDLECNYSDACVSGTRYNFLKPFADSNYTLTVPTSSKDATGFTPTSTVDFMAKGRITLD